ncbi:HAD family hydrolase [Pandoraea sp. PE-S2T-3]|uniref:HAD family hydrolase n=1 Tax=Pandoraea sp. PE-S2T-3 TaxID=1986993 RepID=UPI003F8F67C8
MRQMMKVQHNIVFMLDVDNTLLDNDHFLLALKQHMAEQFGDTLRDHFFSILESLRVQLGYVDYLSALQCFRFADIHDPRMLFVSAYLLDYPFATLLYPDALAVIAHLNRRGTTVIVSDGDAVFQPRKIQRSGLWDAVEGRVLVYVHKERMIDAIEADFPARRYVMVDDKLRLLSIMKEAWGERLTTVFPRQGHYALDDAGVHQYRSPDITLERIGDLLNQTFTPPDAQSAPLFVGQRA